MSVGDDAGRGDVAGRKDVAGHDVAGHDDAGGREVAGHGEAPGAQDEYIRTVVVHVGDEQPARRSSRIPRRAVLAGLGVVVLIAVVAGALMFVGGSGGRHADGAGILASTRSALSHDVFRRPERSTGPMTGAIRLCLQQGTAPAVIEAVGPDKTVGSGWKYLGASVRVFTPSAGHSEIVSMDGYPPALPDQLQPAAGFSVTTPCGDVGNGPYTELLIGLAPTGTSGGWDGILVTYRVGGAQYVLAVGQGFVQCGTAALPGYCGGS